MPSGKAVTNIRIATSESWKDKQTGDMQERTEWHSIVLYDKLGEIAAEYLRKGSQVYIEGKIRTRKWQDKEGKDRYTTEIIAREMQMLGGRGGGGGGGGGSERRRREPRRASRQDERRPPPTAQDGGFDDESRSGSAAQWRLAIAWRAAGCSYRIDLEHYLVSEARFVREE